MESYCHKFYSEEVKDIAVNRFIIAKAELYSKEHIKNVYIYVNIHTVLKYVPYIAS